MSDKEKKLEIVTYPKEHEVKIENDYVDDPKIDDVNNYVVCTSVDPCMN